MQCLLDSIIYLLAILGIIFTTITFFEMFIQKRIINNSYRIFSKNIENNNKEKDINNINYNNKKIDVVIHIENLDKKEEKDLVRSILENENINLKNIATTITIQKDK